VTDPRIADKCRDLVALHSRGYIIWDGRRSEGLGNGQRIAEFVDFDDVRNVAAPADEPDHPAGENQREQEQPPAAICQLRLPRTRSA
jgi:hypothetical protein